ncbi:GNAT family N-acetyltransferase [Streptomyces sp. ICBB 8177]|uniref:GNAT family N-acetyltransferase n=1 Tax=Streptomyces sp. ICBB 8177 TaxID=563922 RepID=UPI000D67435B|nr:GNAT family N-acetyltransferase [Streptomyces sp. ICBB 8177]PWI45823.1 GNAT family N-acetyltransferase [Streptomyces sp. ICBB 8177]
MHLVPLNPVDGALPEPQLTELTSVYASNVAFHRLSGDFPDPEHIDAAQVASSLAPDFAHPASEVLLIRDEPDRSVGVACLLHEHPDPLDTYPWIGLLLIHADFHGQGYGRVAVAHIEARLRTDGRDGARLAVLQNNPKALGFWTTLGYQEIDRRADRQAGRPCHVLHKQFQ